MVPFVRLAIAFALGAMGTSTAHAAQGDSLQAQVFAALSLRNPAQKQRVVKRVDGTLDTLGNSFDYELATGVNGSYGKVLFTTSYQFERQNGVNYVNQSYELRYRAPAYEIGTRLIDSEEGDLYELRTYAEGKILGWVGIGITRQHTRPWLGDAATLARFSLARNRFHVLAMDLNVRAEYETNPTRNRIYFAVEVANFTFGRYAVVPNYQIVRIKQQGTPALSSYEGRVRFVIRI